MNKIFIITILCNDDTEEYIDYINKIFNDKNMARNEMLECANNEFKDLKEVGNFEIVNLDDEIVIYDEDRELVTKYNILEINL